MKRICARCGKEFESKNSRAKYCLECRREAYLERSRQYYAEHREQHKATVSKYRKAHPEKRREYMRSYYAKNRDRILERDRRYHEAHRETEKEKARRYREAHREEINARNRLRYKNNAERFRKYARAWAQLHREQIRERHNRAKTKDSARTADNKIAQFVYVFQLDNELVKIGVATNIKNRISSIESNSGSDVLKVARSQNAFSTNEAVKIEHICHEHFAEQRKRGEFFKITFDEAVAYLKSKTPVKVMK